MNADLQAIVDALNAERLNTDWWHKPEPQAPVTDQLTGRRRARAAADEMAAHEKRKRTA